MSIDLDFDSGQQALAEAVGRFCAARWSDSDARQAGAEDEPQLSRALWSELAELGVLAAGAPGGEGGALEVCAAMEALGHAVFPGPLVASFLAQQVLPEDEARCVGAGDCLVALGKPPLLPWAADADLFLECAEGQIFRAEPRGPVIPQASLGGEAWGRLELVRGPALPGGQRALALGVIAGAAYLVAAANRLIEDAAAYATRRQQFGRTIGEFQAVAHPLADASMGLAAARLLTRAAACAFETDSPGSLQRRTAIARHSAHRAALDAVQTGHQVFGAVGITLEGPAFFITRRIRGLAAQLPRTPDSGDLLGAILGGAR